MEVFNICDYLSFLLVSYCALQNTSSLKQKRNTDRFEVEYAWDYVNFTWPTFEDYKSAVESGKYVPEHNAIAGIKIYKNNVYLALPKIRPGTPVTLAVVPKTSKSKRNVLLRPFPSWRMNTGTNCATLQNVQSMEIDTQGVMWVLDGNRFNNATRCPPKLVLLDLRNRGKLVHSFEFPEDVSSAHGGFLNDLVVDESDGGHAYITEASAHDPGLIVYSKALRRAWKIRDGTMFAELDAVNFTVDGLENKVAVPIDGIALSPAQKNQDRLVYYCALTGHKLHAISNRILKNEQFCKTGTWRRYVKLVGEKPGQSDGLIVDNEGNLYYGLLNMYAVGKWNIYEPFNKSKVIFRDNATVVWPDSFAMDTQGFLYVLNNAIHKYFDPDFGISLNNETHFNIMKIYTGTKSYLYR